MMSWSRNWLSSVVKRDAKVKIALNELSKSIREHKDAAKPSSCRGSGGRVSAIVDLFRPNWKLFTLLTGVCGAASGVLGMALPDFNTGPWADALLRTAVTVFVLGVSLVNLTRSISESGRFAGEYLNESCRMRAFCCLTMLSAVIALIVRSSIAWVPFPVSVVLCGMVLGGTVSSLTMLAFVILETIRCSLPGKAVEVVSKYVARKLTYAYLKEAYVQLTNGKRSECLEQRCEEAYKSTYPPSQYYTRVAWTQLNPGSDNRDCKITIDTHCAHKDCYKDYALDRLASLDIYLQEHGAELYLVSPLYSDNQNEVGTLSFTKGCIDEGVEREVRRRLNRVVRLRPVLFKEEDEDFWDSQSSSLDQVMRKAVGQADPIQVRSYLDAVNRPLKVLRRTRHHRVIRDTYGECVRRGHDFLRLYLSTLREILATSAERSKYRTDHAVVLLRVLRQSIWEEATGLLKACDYHTMKLFTWLVEAIYRSIHTAEDKAGPLWDMRAQFGGFYQFAGSWLDEVEPVQSGDAEEMRQVLYEGLTRWLLLVSDLPGEEQLAKQLCDAAREIVFGRQGITFEHRTSVAQHFVLAGHFIGGQGEQAARAGVVQRLFCAEHSQGLDVDFGELLNFYIEHPFPPQSVDSYLHLFYTPHRTSTDLFTGSSSSSGSGSTGVHKMTLAFIYLGASALADSVEMPEPIAKDLSSGLNDEVIAIVDQLFAGAGLQHGLQVLKAWRDRCSELHGAEEARQIAEAQFDVEKVSEWRREFWEAYARLSPVLSLCLENGNYEIDEDALVELRYLLPKMAVIEWEYPIGGAGGNDYGRSLGRSTECAMLRAMMKAHEPSLSVKGDLAEAVEQAAGWLKARECDVKKALVVVASKRRTSSQLYPKERFVPSWRENIGSKGFDGFYDGYPMIWLRKRDEDDGNGEQVVKSQGDRVMAVDLVGWQGIKVRDCLIAEHKFGDIEIRAWTQKEIDDALESGKLKPEDVGKAKGNCPVEVKLYWQFSPDDLPATKVFEFGAANKTESEHAEPPAPTENSAPASENTRKRPKRAKVVRQKKGAQSRKRQK